MLHRKRGQCTAAIDWERIEKSQHVHQLPIDKCPLGGQNLCDLRSRGTSNPRMFSMSIFYHDPPSELRDTGALGFSVIRVQAISDEQTVDPLGTGSGR